MSEDIDARLQNDTESRIRAGKEPGAGRRSREMDDRDVVESREVSEDDRLEMFRAQLFNDALPDLPEIPGYHVCWLTTANPRDPIHRRLQLGYELLKAHEVPGMEYASMKTGDWIGIVGVNEMVAAKLPLSLYHRYMQEAHHDAPMREEDKLADTNDMIKTQLESVGSQVVEGDGLSELRRGRPAAGEFED